MVIRNIGDLARRLRQMQAARKNAAFVVRLRKLHRCDEQVLVIAESQTNFQLNFDVVKEARAGGDSVELQLSEGPSVLIYSLPTK